MAPAPPVSHAKVRFHVSAPVAGTERSWPDGTSACSTCPVPPPRRGRGRGRAPRPTVVVGKSSGRTFLCRAHRNAFRHPCNPEPGRIWSHPDDAAVRLKVIRVREPEVAGDASTVLNHDPQPTGRCEEVGDLDQARGDNRIIDQRTRRPRPSLKYRGHTLPAHVTQAGTRGTRHRDAGRENPGVPTDGRTVMVPDCATGRSDILALFGTTRPDLLSEILRKTTQLRIVGPWHRISALMSPRCSTA